MLRTMSHVLVEDMVEYDACQPRRTADAGLHGLGARYRLYETDEDWVFLAASAPSEWDALAAGFLPHVDLAADARFADEAARVRHDDELAEVLATAFRAQSASAWEEQLLARERRERLARALAKLPERQRSVFMLSHYEGCTSREVSVVTGLNESTVRVHLFRAIRKLRTLLGEGQTAGTKVEKRRVHS
jgi:RNA polymerase sigma factor (sigma-70 family)